MADFGYSILGMRELQTKIDRLVELSVDEAQTQIDRAARLIQNTAINQINKGGRSGNSYIKGGKRGTRSASGEWPKSDTGDLVKNITIDNPAELTATIGSTEKVPYGKWLEFGTSKMSARPWLARSFKANERKITKNFERALRKIKP